ncbi:MAG: hypothetical protein Tsb009_26000 [Planctomycetaceae bacterium]
MTEQLLEEIGRLLPQLESAQNDLASHFEEKSNALRTANVPEILRLSEQEKTIVARLQSYLAKREEILNRARQAGHSSQSLEELIPMIAPEQGQPLVEMIARSKQMVEELRRQSWIHWIVSQRTFMHYSELLEFLAHGGKPAPTYCEKSNQQSGGGTLVDASI